MLKLFYTTTSSGGSCPLKATSKGNGLKLNLFATMVVSDKREFPLALVFCIKKETQEFFLRFFALSDFDKRGLTALFLCLLFLFAEAHFGKKTRQARRAFLLQYPAHHFDRVVE